MHIAIADVIDLRGDADAAGAADLAEVAVALQHASPSLRPVGRQRAEPP